MSEMIERVAKALRDYEAGVLLDTGTVNPSGKEYFEGKARAAIEAMREPTQVMLDAAWSDSQIAADSDEFKEAWQAMIDAALHG